MREHVADGLAEARVRFDLFVVELLTHPLMEFLHDRSALFLVKGQPLGGGKLLFPALVVIAIDGAQAFEHMAAFLRKIIHHLDEVPPAMRQTMA